MGGCIRIVLRSGPGEESMTSVRSYEELRARLERIGVHPGSADYYATLYGEMEITELKECTPVIAIFTANTGRRELLVEAPKGKAAKILSLLGDELKAGRAPEVSLEALFFTAAVPRAHISSTSVQIHVYSGYRARVASEVVRLLREAGWIEGGGQERLVAVPQRAGIRPGHARPRPARA